MISALNYLGTLPDQTIVYNGHEYTAGSLAFGKHIDPNNPGLARLSDILQKNKNTAGLTTIGDEKEWNVFMRLDSEAVKFVCSLRTVQHTADRICIRRATASESDTPESAIISALREQKNKFRG
jgi:hydroxyacylglutathione hydrolase